LLNEKEEKPENLEVALKIWYDLRSQRACERTVAILRSLGRKEYIIKYSQWVFEMNPELGL
jgi:hypothetical protein